MRNKKIPLHIINLFTEICMFWGNVCMLFNSLKIIKSAFFLSFCPFLDTFLLSLLFFVIVRLCWQ